MKNKPVAEHDPDVLRSLDEICDIELSRRRGSVTKWRWLAKGVAGVVLPSEFVGGQRMTTLRKFREWRADVGVARQKQADARKAVKKKAAGPRRRQKAAAA